MLIWGQKATEEFHILFQPIRRKTEQLVEARSYIENNKVVLLKEVIVKHVEKQINASILTSPPK